MQEGVGRGWFLPSLLPFSGLNLWKSYQKAASTTAPSAAGISPHSRSLPASLHHPISQTHVIIFSNITPGALGCADTQSKVGKAGKCWQRRQEGSGNLSHVLVDVVGARGLCASMQSKRNLKNLNIVLRLR